MAKSKAGILSAWYRHACFAVLLTVASTGLQAEPGPLAYETVVISDTPSGRALLAGDHKTVIAGKRAESKRGFADINNLCVAYMRDGNPEKAIFTCKRAVDKSQKMSRRDQAIALSNLGVIRALDGDVSGAMHAFWAASRLSDDLEVPAENFIRLTARLTRLVAAI